MVSLKAIGNKLRVLLVIIYKLCDWSSGQTFRERERERERESRQTGEQAGIVREKYRVKGQQAGER